MRLFPGETERIDEVEKDLAGSINLAERMYHFWLTHPRDEWLAQSGIGYLSGNLALLMDVQACRQFRTVVELCRRAEAFCGAIVSRSLFETVLAQHFILAKRLRIVLAPKGKKPGEYQALIFDEKTMTAKPQDWLSRELRAELYFAHIYLSDVAMFNEMAQQPGHKRLAKKSKIPANVLAELDKAIGSQWSFVLRNRPWTYSGLRLGPQANISHSKFHRWHKTIYASQSRCVHASDIRPHADMSEEGKIKAVGFSSSREVYKVLRTGMAMFFENIRLLQKNIGFGRDVDIACESLARSFHTTKGESA